MLSRESDRVKAHKIFTQMRSHLHFTPFELHTQNNTKKNKETERAGEIVCVSG